MGILAGGSIPLNTLWDYVYNTWLTGNLNVGLLNGVPTPGHGTNSVGKLQTVLSAGKACYPDFSSLPYVGVDLPRVLPRAYAARRRDKVTVQFKIAATVSVTAETNGVLRLSDAWQALATIIDDDNGNGLQPIVRNDLTLGANAISSIIRSIEPGWSRLPGDGSGYAAWMDMLIDVEIEAQA